jgi:GDP-L-fucose synthase
VNAAGRAAGIQGNLNNSRELLEINARIALNISKAAHELGVQHVIQFASACVYPLNDRTASQPSDLGKGLIEESSKSYAMSKLLAIEIFSAYRKQYENQWVTIIPSNLYGAGDWNHGSNGHVASMLLERFFEARKNSLQEVTVWGDGQSLRNFLNVQDLAKAVKFVIDNEIWDEEVINICGEPEISIEQLTQLIAQTTGYTGNVLFDETKPNGARRKMLDDSYIRSFGWFPTISLEDGFAEYYKSYLDNL